MKSVCVKIGTQNELDFFLEEYKKNYIDKTKISIKKFKIYYNFIIHYFGEEHKKFLYSISLFLSTYIIDKYEEKLIVRCINKNYFYFDEYDKKVILKIAMKILEIQAKKFDQNMEKAPGKITIKIQMLSVHIFGSVILTNTTFILMFPFMYLF